jgi:chromosomal replication initiation ATPase DnaA
VAREEKAQEDGGTMITKEELKTLIEEGEGVRERLLQAKAELREQLHAVDEALTRIPVSGTVLRLERQRSMASEVGRPGSPLNSQDILHAVAIYYRVTVAAIKGPGRQTTLTRTRHIAMYLARKIAAESYPEIGLSFGQRDHTTVISAYNRIVAELLEDKQLKTEVDDLECILQEAQALRLALTPPPKPEDHE